MRVGADDAARHGLHQGALVLESTLAGTPSNSSNHTGQGQSPTQEAIVSMQLMLYFWILSAVLMFIAECSTLGTCIMMIDLV